MVEEKFVGRSSKKTKVPSSPASPNSERRALPPGSYNNARERVACSAMGKKTDAPPVRMGAGVKEDTRVGWMLWCRGVTLVVLLVSFLAAIFYASSRVRFVEDVLPQISGASRRHPVEPSPPLPQHTHARTRLRPPVGNTPIAQFWFGFFVCRWRAPSGRFFPLARNHASSSVETASVDGARAPRRVHGDARRPTTFSPSSPHRLTSLSPPPLRSNKRLTSRPKKKPNQRETNRADALLRLQPVRGLLRGGSRRRLGRGAV